MASPALLFSLVVQADLAHLFSHTLTVSLIAIGAAAVAYLVASRALFGRFNAATVIGTLCASYTNAGNLGLPIAAAIMGDMTWMAPIMLVQIGLLDPNGRSREDDRFVDAAAKIQTGRHAMDTFGEDSTTTEMCGLHVVIKMMSTCYSS